MPANKFARSKIVIQYRKSDALLSRALSFIASSDALVSREEEGWLHSSLLLQGFAAELVVKKQLFETGKTEKELSKNPYAHNILNMWRDDTDLLTEAIAIDLSFEEHFSALDAAHTKTSNYAIRYGGDIETPDPRVIAPVLKEIIRRERMRRASAQSNP